MGRAIFGLLLGFAIVFGVAFWARTCLPDPGGSGVEWLHREDVIVVQMKSVPVLRPEAFKRATVPDFTLYGDGTLVFTDPTREGTDAPVLQTTLSSHEIRALLKAIADTGFMNFDYAQPKPNVPEFPTTYVYVSTKRAANAVSAYAIDQPAPDGKTWSQFRKVQQVNSRLKRTMTDAIQGSATTFYAIDPMIVFAQVTPPGGGDPPDWPIPLAAIAGKSGMGERRIEGDLSREVEQKLGSVRGSMFLLGFQSFVVAYRPVLPHEDKFPEFEPPKQ